jgi:hypothetical protein
VVHPARVLRVRHNADVGTEDRADQRRDDVVRFGPPLVVPSDAWAPGWYVSGVHHTRSLRAEDSEVVGVVVSAPIAGGHVTITTHGSSWPTQPRVIEVSNVLQASVPEDVELPFTVTVDESNVELSLDGEPHVFRVLATRWAWMAETRVGERTVSIAGRGALPPTVALETLADLSTVPASRF